MRRFRILFVLVGIGLLLVSGATLRRALHPASLSPASAGQGPRTADGVYDDVRGGVIYTNPANWEALTSRMSWDHMAQGDSNNTLYASLASKDANALKQQLLRKWSPQEYVNAMMCAVVLKQKEHLRVLATDSNVNEAIRNFVLVVTCGVSTMCETHDMIEILLESGANPDIPGVLGPVILGEDATRTVKLLLDHGARPDKRVEVKEGKIDDPPLHEACRVGNVEIVRMLIEHGADVNRQDQYGWTPLMAFCVGRLNDMEDKTEKRSRHLADTKVPKLLLKHGANPEIRDKRGESALDFVKKNGDKSMVRLLERHVPVGSGSSP